MPPIKVLVMDPRSSDHSHLSITIGGEEIRGHKTFNFFNCLANDANFLFIIVIGWSGKEKYGTMKTVWQKLKKVKNELKQLNRKAFHGVATDRVKKFRNKMQAQQLTMRDFEKAYNNSPIEKI